MPNGERKRAINHKHENITKPNGPYKYVPIISVY